MSKKWLVASLVMLLTLTLVGSSVLAKASWDNRAETKEKVKVYNIPVENMKQRALPERPGQDEQIPPSRRPLGAVAQGTSDDIPFNAVDLTYNDLLYYNVGGYQVVQDETANRKVHFAYQNLDDPSDNRQFGYQVYDPSAGSGSTFPQGTDGCIVQPGTDYGRNPKVDVFPTGRPIMAGYDSASGDIDFHAYWDLTGNCLWGAGSQLDPASYNNLPGMTTNDNQMLTPIIRVQDVGGTLYTHVAVSGTGVADYWGANSSSDPIVYYRTSGNPPSGTWTNGIVIDTTMAFYGFNLACSRVSDKVVISYVKPTPDAIAENNGLFDTDVYYCESTDGGVTWGTRNNITNYQRDVASAAAWLEANPMYDSEDNLHIIWNAGPTPADAYGVGGYNWGFDWGVLYWHWRRLEVGGDTNTSVFHDADWADGGQPVCGFGGTGQLAASFATMGECAGRLYVVFAMANDMSVEPQLLDDCMSDQTDGVYSGMHELYMVVSSDLTGDAWDSYRNITHTYSPSVYDENNEGCDSATGNGICYDEKQPSLFDLGFDVTEHPYNDIDSVLTAFYDPSEWDDPGQIPMQGTWTNDSALHLLFTYDHWGGRASAGRGEYTLNEVAWIRLGCVDPIVAAKISADQRSFAWPDYVQNGDEDTMTIALFNSGNTDLIIDSIVAYEETGSVGGWLGLSGSTLPNIPIQSTSTFDIYLNESGVIDNGVGGSEEALGTVVIYSNAANNDSLVIDIQMFVADEVQGMAYDTIATADLFAKSAGDDIALIVDNVGSMGNNGNGVNGGATMDFLDSQECDTSNAVNYLYSGGPMLLHNQGDTVLISSSMHADGLSRENSFVPLVGGVGGGLQGGTTDDYDSVYTGEFANWDTSCVMTRTLYAPRNSAANPSFIVACTKLYQPDGAAGTIDNLTVGTAIDWDVPGMGGSDDSSSADNTSGIATSGKYVYLVGSDSAGYDGSACQSNTGRFAGDAFLASYFTSDIGGTGSAAPHGVFSDRFHDWWDDLLDTAVAQIWDTLGAYTGLTATDSRNDLAVFQTVKHDFSLPAGDTLVFWSVMATERDGDGASFDLIMETGIGWATSVVCPQCIVGCCIGQRGDIDLDSNGDGSTCTPEEQVADIGDLTNLINHLFISFDPICCPDEADIAPIDTPNPGDVGDGVVDIGDLTSYINYLFITFVAPGGC